MTQRYLTSTEARKANSRDPCGRASPAGPPGRTLTSPYPPAPRLQYMYKLQTIPSLSLPQAPQGILDFRAVAFTHRTRRY